MGSLAALGRSCGGFLEVPLRVFQSHLDSILGPCVTLWEPFGVLGGLCSAIWLPLGGSHRDLLVSCLPSFSVRSTRFENRVYPKAISQTLREAE